MVFLKSHLNPKKNQRLHPSQRHLTEMPRWNDGVHSACKDAQKKTWKITRGLCGLMMINGYEWWFNNGLTTINGDLMMILKLDLV